MGASRLVSAGRGSTSGSGRGTPPLDAARRSTWEPRGSFLLAEHTHVDSLTHTRQTHTRSLTVPFAHGARAGASLDTHTVDAHTFAHGARARFTLDTHLGASRLVSAGRGSTSGSGRCPSAFRGPPPLMLPGAALGSLAARFCWQGQHFRLWTVPERVSGPRPLMLPGAALGRLQALDGARARFGAPPLDAARRSLGASRLVSAGRGSTSGSGRYPSAFRGPPP